MRNSFLSASALYTFLDLNWIFFSEIQTNVHEGRWVNQESPYESTKNDWQSFGKEGHTVPYRWHHVLFWLWIDAQTSAHKTCR